jgi:catechol 2,3-dioxygenase-like lactoylglutathione lyase family enzyme
MRSIFRSGGFYSRALVGPALIAAVGASTLWAQNADPAGAAWNWASPSFVALSVSDLDRSVAWYRHVLGLNVVREVEAGDGSARVRLLRESDVVVELIGHQNPIDVDPSVADQPGFRFLGLFKSGFFVRGIDAFHVHLRSLEIDADATIGTDEVLGMRTFVFRDPDGNRLQVFERGAGR